MPVPIVKVQGFAPKLPNLPALEKATCKELFSNEDLRIT
jgi:hypothetical protein